MNKKTKFSFRYRLLSFRFAFNGIKESVKEQHNLWIHIFVAIITVLLSLILEINKYEWILIIFAIGFVISAEIFNSSIENIVDKISPEKSEMAEKVKDAAAGAVLIASIGAFIIGLLIFIPYIIEL